MRDQSAILRTSIRIWLISSTRAQNGRNPAILSPKIGPMRSLGVPNRTDGQRCAAGTMHTASSRRARCAKRSLWQRRGLTCAGLTCVPSSRWNQASVCGATHNPAHLRPLKATVKCRQPIRGIVSRETRTSSFSTRRMQLYVTSGCENSDFRRSVISIR